MRQTFCSDVFCSDRLKRVLLSLLIATLSLAIPAGAKAQNTALEDLVSAVVRIKTFINPDGSSVSNLGREREGSGTIIDESGLVLTIGYLMVEAHAAEIVTTSGRTLPATVVGYDHETGFGLLRRLSLRRSSRFRLASRPISRSRTRCWRRALAAPAWCCRCAW